MPHLREAFTAQPPHTVQNKPRMARGRSEAPAASTDHSWDNQELRHRAACAAAPQRVTTPGLMRVDSVGIRVSSSASSTTLSRTRGEMRSHTVWIKDSTSCRRNCHGTGQARFDIKNHLSYSFH